MCNNSEWRRQRRAGAILCNIVLFWEGVYQGSNLLVATLSQKKIEKQNNDWLKRKRIVNSLIFRTKISYLCLLLKMQSFILTLCKGLILVAPAIYWSIFLWRASDPLKAKWSPLPMVIHNFKLITNVLPPFKVEIGRRVGRGGVGIGPSHLRNVQNTITSPLRQFSVRL